MVELGCGGGCGGGGRWGVVGTSHDAKAHLSVSNLIQDVQLIKLITMVMIIDQC